MEGVSSGRPGRRLASALGILLVSLPILLTFVPWQQNVPGTGSVTALSPADRIRTIPAPVSGRLVKLLVQEGSRVQKGDVLAEMQDQDPNFFMLLEQRLGLAREKVEASNQKLQFLDQQMITYEGALLSAQYSAQASLRAAIEKVREAERAVDGHRPVLTQKRLDYERKKAGNELGVTSDLDFQEAESIFLSAQQKLEGLRSKVKQARAEEDAKLNDVDKIKLEDTAKITETDGKRETAKGELALAKKALTEAQTAVSRQETQVITAPLNGTILSIAGATSAELMAQGQPVIEFVPDTDQLAVELWMRGVDAPLITLGRKSRIQFEGWPAVQVSGWPSTAVGTFGGVVALVDAQASADGRVRVLLTPDPNEDKWPDNRYLRQGVRASGWIQLDTVSAGYEIWRQLNAFPPSLRNAPGDIDTDKGKETKMQKPSSSGKKP